MVWCDSGVSIIMTEKTSPVKEFMMALGAVTGASGGMSEKKRTGIAKKLFLVSPDEDTKCLLMSLLEERNQSVLIQGGSMCVIRHQGY